MGTHPIFESDFDCLTDKMSTKAKIPEADLQNVSLKSTETVEKVILPSAEDVNRERVPLDAASFQKENLKKVTPIVNDQIQRESSILVSIPGPRPWTQTLDQGPGVPLDPGHRLFV